MQGNFEELFDFIVICIVYTTLFLQIDANYMYHSGGLQDELKQKMYYNKYTLYIIVFMHCWKKNEFHFPTIDHDGKV